MQLRHDQRTTCSGRAHRDSLASRNLGIVKILVEPRALGLLALRPPEPRLPSDVTLIHVAMALKRKSVDAPGAVLQKKPRPCALSLPMTSFLLRFMLTFPSFCNGRGGYAPRLGIGHFRGLQDYLYRQWYPKGRQRGPSPVELYLHL